MSTTVAQLYVRAKQSTPANAEVVPRASEVLALLESEQQAIFANLAGVTRDRYQTTATITSTSAASARVFDLSGLSPSVERVLQVTLSDGREARQVDPIDTDAELSPRYIVRGQTLVEVSNDWRIGSASVTATLLYVYGPTALDVTSDYTQAVSLPDPWCELLELPLRIYLAGLRPMTSPSEISDLASKLDRRTTDFVNYLTNFGGIRSNRFDIPTPTPVGKK